jgi:hypothetical protein
MLACKNGAARVTDVSVKIAVNDQQGMRAGVWMGGGRLCVCTTHCACSSQACSVRGACVSRAFRQTSLRQTHALLVLSTQAGFSISIDAGGRSVPHTTHRVCIDASLQWWQHALCVGLAD